MKTKDIKELHNIGNDDVKKMLEEKFPEIFKEEKKYFNFGSRHVLNMLDNTPLLIGNVGMAEFRQKYLVVGSQWELETGTLADGRTILMFRKKTND